MFRRAVFFVLSLCPLALVLCALTVSAFAQAVRTTPIDTVELALTKPGQSAATVRARLGTPAQVMPLPTEYRVERDRAGATAIPVQREVWMYRGNSQVGDALITLVNGTVESAERRR